VSSPTTPQFHLFLPQMRLSIDQLVERAQAAEAAGFTGLALMDHLAPPFAEEHPMYEAMALAGWLLARTERLKVSHLVLCDAFRHPSVLAREAVTLDHASGGRFELGIGSGSAPDELAKYGIDMPSARDRTDRLTETLDVITRLWTGEPVDHHGAHFDLTEAAQRPTPLTSIPLIIGGAGPRTMQLVAQYADWWNCPVHRLDKLNEMRGRVGKARVSVQERIAYVKEESERDEVVGLARNRYPRRGMVTGDADELIAHFRAQMATGIERFYVWFTDFAQPGTLAAFGERVIAALA
jgi:alkanesulfonate monooxygenase SsuD/methylene tetrahydromethanopterin reductase-like flavin-dependent oxidoreductase (luciferase family)